MVVIIIILLIAVLFMTGKLFATGLAIGAIGLGVYVGIKLLTKIFGAKTK